MLHLIILHVFMCIVRRDCLLFYTISNWMSSWILFKGYFGDVNKGIYKPMGIVVAVKTCKETFTQEQTRTLLTEGRILKQYAHPNIVRFIGIAAQRQPVMIVMEYVEGKGIALVSQCDNCNSKNCLNYYFWRKMINCWTNSAFNNNIRCVNIRFYRRCSFKEGEKIILVDLFTKAMIKKHGKGYKYS